MPLAVFAELPYALARTSAKLSLEQGVVCVTPGARVLGSIRGSVENHRLAAHGALGLR